MSSSDLAISVRGLGKSYTIAHNAASHSTLGEALIARLRNPFRRQRNETFWAVRGVSFDIAQGEVVGVIGRNGAGKSTLLKVLSRIVEPTEGEVDLHGRVGSLLEVGTGFHPELTGRENIYLNGAILGMTRREITKQFDAIVDFAGVSRFLDTPVKRYSSGMYVRLAFAVAAHLNPDILVVDEVLAVGDAEFQNKCLGKMREVATSGRTVLFVSHHLAAVRRLCGSGIVLDRGGVAFIGDANDAIEHYERRGGAADSADAPRGPQRVYRNAARRLEAAVVRSDLLPTKDSADGYDLELVLRVSTEKPLHRFGVGLDLWTGDGMRVCRLIPPVANTYVGECVDTTFVRLRIPMITNYLISGSYRLDLAIEEAGAGYLLAMERAFEFTVPEIDLYGSGMAPRQVHHGVVPLPVQVEVVQASREPVAG